jgi:CO/xanthine dehydrogenase FAD-binding subunit
MITEYHRPANLESAMVLLKRKTPVTYPLAGGTSLLLRKSDDFAVVDIQDLKLNTIQQQDGKIRIGSGVTLQQMVDDGILPAMLRKASRSEASFNIRQAATIGGTIASGDGHSALLTVLLAINADVYLASQEKPIALGELLPLRGKLLTNNLITEISITENLTFTYQKVAKTPVDVPLILVCATQWSGGRTRIVVGGPLPTPKLAMDGTSATGADVAASNLLAGEHPYLGEMAAVLTKRCLQQLQDGGNHGH